MFACRLEDLPDELLLIICRYLTGIEILLAWSSLNVRLTRLIGEFSRQIDLNRIPSRWIDRFETTILPSIQSDIESIVLDNDYQRFPLDFSRFVHLQSLSIGQDFSLDYLFNLREIQLNSLPVDPQMQRDLIERFFFFSNAEHGQLRSLSLISYHGLTFSGYSQRSTSRLTRLKITLKSNIDLFVLLDILSAEIEELLVEIIYNGPLRDLTLLAYHFSHLRMFRLKTIFEDSIRFDQLERLVSQSFPCLDELVVELFTRDASFLDGRRWEIFLRKLTFLKRFSCSIRYRFKIDADVDREEQILRSFSTDFWLHEHRWFVNVYSTCPSIDENQAIPHFQTNSYGKLFLFTDPYASPSIDINRDLRQVRSTGHSSSLKKSFWNVRQVHFDGENLPLAEEELKTLLNRFRWLTELKLDRLIVTTADSPSSVRLDLPRLSRLTLEKVQFSLDLLELPSMFNLRYLCLPHQCLPSVCRMSLRVETLVLSDCRDLQLESLWNWQDLRVLKLSVISFDRLLDNHGDLMYQLISLVFRPHSSIESLQLMCPGANRTKIQLFEKHFPREESTFSLCQIRRETLANRTSERILLRQERQLIETSRAETSLTDGIAMRCVSSSMKIIGHLFIRSDQKRLMFNKTKDFNISTEMEKKGTTTQREREKPFR